MDQPGMEESVSGTLLTGIAPQLKKTSIEQLLAEMQPGRRNMKN